MNRFSNACATIEVVNPVMDAWMYCIMYEQILTGCNGKVTSVKKLS